MFSRLIPKRYHHLCPEYQAFTLIVLKPNEAFVEPKRAARRLRQCMAILIYAQQWIHEVVDSKLVICPVDVTRSLTRIVEILGDRNATWNSNGRIMRPANLLLDCFGALYESLNCLQRTIKDLTGRPVYLAQNRNTRCLIGQQFTKIRTAISELLTVMEAMPRRKAGAAFDVQSHALLLDDHEEGEEAIETVDARFGFTLSNASLEEVNQIKHRSVSVLARERKRPKMASSLRSNSQTSLESSEPLELREMRASVELDEKEVLTQHLDVVDQQIMASTPIDIRLDEANLLANERASGLPDPKVQDSVSATAQDRTVSSNDDARAWGDTEEDARSLHEAVEATLARWSVISGESSDGSRRSTNASGDSLCRFDTQSSVRQISEADAASIKDIIRAHRFRQTVNKGGGGVDVRPASSMKRTNRPEPILTPARSSLSRSNAHQRARRASKTAAQESGPRMTQTTTSVLYKFPRPCSSLGSPQQQPPTSRSMTRGDLPDLATLKRYRLVPDLVLPARTPPPTSPLPTIPGPSPTRSSDTVDAEDVEREYNILRLDKTQQYKLSELAHLQSLFGPRLERVDIKAAGKRDIIAGSRLSSNIAFDGRHWCFA